MVHYDVFNGDADGLCALVQMRLEDPKDGEIVTGVKRNIRLFQNLNLSKGDSILAMDISLARNHDLVIEALQKGVEITWIDHHLPGDEIENENLSTHIDVSPDVCTSVIVDRLLQGKRKSWAAVAAFGDSMTETGNSLCEQCGMIDEINSLKRLGRLLNYNSYGRNIEDLWINPKKLFQSLLEAEDPLTFIDTDEYKLLSEGYDSDYSKARECISSSEDKGFIILPNEAWAFRISGTLAHIIAEEEPDIPHIIATELENNALLISLRAPKNNPTGAGEICSRFGGGGRAAAGGVDKLPMEYSADFINAVHARWNQ